MTSAVTLPGRRPRSGERGDRVGGGAVGAGVAVIGGRVVVAGGLAAEVRVEVAEGGVHGVDVDVGVGVLEEHGHVGEPPGSVLCLLWLAVGGILLIPLRKEYGCLCFNG